MCKRSLGTAGSRTRREETCAMRVDDGRILLSPSMMSEHKHCRIGDRGAACLIDYDCNILEGTGAFSREGQDARPHYEKYTRNRRRHPRAPFLHDGIRRGVQTHSAGNGSDAEDGRNGADPPGEGLQHGAWRKTRTSIFSPCASSLKKRGCAAYCRTTARLRSAKHIEQAFSVVERVECRCGLQSVLEN